DFNEQIFGVDKQVRGREQSDKEGFGPTVSPQLVQSGKGRIASDPALLDLPRSSMAGAFSVQGKSVFLTFAYGVMYVLSFATIIAVFATAIALAVFVVMVACRRILQIVCTRWHPFKQPFPGLHLRH